MSGRRGIVLLDNRDCRLIEENEKGYRFQYLKEFLASPNPRAISLTLPCRPELYEAEQLFPFFSGLVSEGTLHEIQCRTYQIDENDDFGLLLETAGGDVIGAVTVRRLEP
jgi:serine/threonine-protein kinase HipA